MRRLLVLTVTTVVLVTACGGGKSPQQIVVAAGDLTTEARTARFSQSQQITAAEGQPDMPTTDAEGEIDFTDLRMRMSMDVAGQQADALFDHGTIYMKM